MVFVGVVSMVLTVSMRCRGCRECRGCQRFQLRVLELAASVLPRAVDAFVALSRVAFGSAAFAVHIHLAVGVLAAIFGLAVVAPGHRR